MEPPKKDSEPTPENIAKLEQWLNSIIAGHPGATRTYTFYEEIDKYLGPWGKEGYPIGYGQAQAINSLNWLRAAIERRELDVPPTLDEIIRRLNAREYPDMRTAALARKVIESARQRKAALTYGYRMELLDDPSLRPFYDKYLQGWDRP